MRERGVRKRRTGESEAAKGQQDEELYEETKKLLNRKAEAEAMRRKRQSGSKSERLAYEVLRVREGATANRKGKGAGPEAEGEVRRKALEPEDAARSAA